MNKDRQNQITGRQLAQNAIFFALFSVFVAFGLTLLVLWLFIGISKLNSMPKHDARVLLAWIYGLSWLLSAVVLGGHRCVQLFRNRKHEAESMTAGEPLVTRSRSVAVWMRKGFFVRTYFLMDGTNKLYTLEQKGEEAIMYNESARLRIDAKKVVTDEVTGQQLATADLKVEQLVTAHANEGNKICGSIRCVDGATYVVTFTAGNADLNAQDGARFVSIQGSTMSIDTNVSLLDKNVAAVCLILSSFLVLGDLQQL